MANLDAEIEDLLTALRLTPRKVWAYEVAQLEVAGRCAGSYGCGPQPDQLGGGEKSSDDFIDNLVNLISAGVQIEHAIAALARKYESESRMEAPLAKLLKILRNPESTREDFGQALSDVASVSGSRVDPKAVMIAVLKGKLDQL